MGAAVARRHLAGVEPCTARSTGRWSRRWASRAAARAVRRRRPSGAPRDAAAMQLCLLRETLATSTPRPRPRSRCRGSAPTRSSSPATPRPATGGCPGSASGDVVPAFALSEPDAGSDAGALALEAEPDGDGWRLHGTKTWISNAPDADVYSVFARTTPDARARGVTAFAVAGDSRGAQRRAPRHGRPPRARHASLRRRPGLARRRARRGRRGLRASRCAPSTCSGPSVGAFAVGMAQAALDASLAWAHGARAVRRAR